MITLLRWREIHTILNHKRLNNGWIFLYQVTKLLIPLAYFARVWAALLPLRSTWRKRVDLKECNLCRMLTMRFAIAIGKMMVPLSALKTMRESVSKITSLIPISHAKETASSIAFPYASNEPSYKGRCLLMAASTDPSWSRIKAPTPTELSWLKIAASTLILYHGGDGGTQRESMASLCCSGRWCASWNLLSMPRALWRIWLPICLGWPIRTLFLLNHMHYAMVTISSRRSFPTCF